MKHLLTVFALLAIISASPNLAFAQKNVDKQKSSVLDSVQSKELEAHIQDAMKQASDALAMAKDKLANVNTDSLLKQSASVIKKGQSAMKAAIAAGEKALNDPQTRSAIESALSTIERAAQQFESEWNKEEQKQ